MQYSNELLDYFHHLDHTGRLTGDAVATAKLGTVAQGDILELFIESEAEMILAARFQAYGSVVLLAMLEYTCRWLQGKTHQQALALTPQMLLSALKLQQVKLHTAHQICKAIRHCLMET